MKRIGYHMIAFFLLCATGALPMRGQQAPAGSLLRSPLFREKLILTTDRVLYAAGDRILFRVFDSSDPLLIKNQWSMVLYLELVSDRQVAVARGKFLLGEEGASGQLTIPDTVTTGNYSLRAYTRWMRNFTASAFASLPLGVVHPRQLDADPWDRSQSDSLDPVCASGERLSQDKENGSGGLVCEPEQLVYQRKDTVAVKIQLEELAGFPGGFAISIVKKEYTDPYVLALSEVGRATIGNEGSVAYPPETRGISVSGKVVHREDRMPVPYARIHVTLLGNAPDYLELVADQDGSISFCVPPRPGISNALIAFDPEKGSTSELVLEDAYSRDFKTPGDAGPDYIQQRAEAVRELGMLAQLREAFDVQGTPPQASPDSSIPVYFYGTPEYRYRPSDYVALPSVGEFFFELVPQVSLQRYRGQRLLSVMDDAGYFLEYAPLVLLDHVAIQELETLLSIDPSRLKTIDVVNKIYIRGGNTYGGIISLISREGNLAGAGLPEGATIIELQTVEGRHSPWPQNITLPSRMNRLPDLRTTLYWEPAKLLKAGEETWLKFRSSDIPGTYVVYIRGVTPEGKVIQSRCEFEVE